MWLLVRMFYVNFCTMVSQVPSEDPLFDHTPQDRHAQERRGKTEKKARLKG